MIAKWIGDAQGVDGIYSVWIAMRRYPWLPPIDFKDTYATTGEDIMKAADRLVRIEDSTVTVDDLGMLPDKNFFESLRFLIVVRFILQRKCWLGIHILGFLSLVGPTL